LDPAETTGKLKRIPWGNLTLLIAFGMLFYSLIVSPGYYIQSGVPDFVVLFAVLLAVGIVAAVVQILAVLSSTS
jgi:hypothetical protein